MSWTATLKMILTFLLFFVFFCFFSCRTSQQGQTISLQLTGHSLGDPLFDERLFGFPSQTDTQYPSSFLGLMLLQRPHLPAGLGWSTLGLRLKEPGTVSLFFEFLQPNSTWPQGCPSLALSGTGVDLLTLGRIPFPS